MAVLDIRKYPDPVLREKAGAVGEIDGEVRRIISDMVETLYAAKGVGLAAPQVGVSIRLIVIDMGLAEGEEKSPLVLINPEIIGSEGSVSGEEGCLSLPDFTVDVSRAEKVVVRGLDGEGRKLTVRAEGLLARVLQHEADHLDGTLLLDKAGFLSREFYKKRIKKTLSKTG
jgi:peptide deformylase